MGKETFSSRIAESRVHLPPAVAVVEQICFSSGICITDDGVFCQSNEHLSLAHLQAASLVQDVDVVLAVHTELSGKAAEEEISWNPYCILVSICLYGMSEVLRKTNMIINTGTNTISVTISHFKAEQACAQKPVSFPSS